MPVLFIELKSPAGPLEGFYINNIKFFFEKLDQLYNCVMKTINKFFLIPKNWTDLWYENNKYEFFTFIILLSFFTGCTWFTIIFINNEFLSSTGPLISLSLSILGGFFWISICYAFEVNYNQIISNSIHFIVNIIFIICIPILIFNFINYWMIDDTNSNLFISTLLRYYLLFVTCIIIFLIIIRLILYFLNFYIFRDIKLLKRQLLYWILGLTFILLLKLFLLSFVFFWFSFLPVVLADSPEPEDSARDFGFNNQKKDALPSPSELENQVKEWHNADKNLALAKLKEELTKQGYIDFDKSGKNFKEKFKNHKSANIYNYRILAKSTADAKQEWAFLCKYAEKNMKENGRNIFDKDELEKYYLTKYMTKYNSEISNKYLVSEMKKNITYVNHKLDNLKDLNKNQ